MRVVVDMMQCESNAICIGHVPEVFAMGDDDVLVLLDEQPDEALGVRLKTAALSCPKMAITVED